MESSEVRRCASIKSRKHRDAQCPYAATQGDFCTRHSKNSIRFVSALPTAFLDKPTTRAELQAVRRLQKFWRRWSAYARFRRQGVVANCLDMAQNQTEVFSLDPLQTIPRFFLFSLVDEQKKAWVFDIRSLGHMITEGDELLNPYTREPIGSRTLHKIHQRAEWLRARKYPLLYATGENLTAQQIWNQKVLDVFFRMEHLGYRASCRWFEDMTPMDHEDLYRCLHHLWYVQLGLTQQEKEAILPGHNAPLTKVFRHNPDKLQGGIHDLTWWRKHNLHLIREFLTRSPNKAQQALGALYVLMGIVQIVPEAARAYPWVLDTVR